MTGRNPTRGTVLMATLIVIVVLSATLAAGLSVGHSSLTASRHRSDMAELRYAASAGLAQARSFISAAPYDANGNAWLQADGNIMEGGAIVAEPPVDQLIAAAQAGSPIATSSSALSFACGDATVRVYVYQTSPGLYRFVSVARHDREPLVVARAQNVRERASFARYIFFRETSINFGSTTTAGDVHANATISFSEEFHSYGPVTATGGFNFQRNAVAPDEPGGNVFFYDHSDGGADSRERPQIQDLQSLKGILPETSPFLIERNTGPNSYWRATFGMSEVRHIDAMRFEGSEVVMTVTGRTSAGQTVTSPALRLPIPEAGLIYAESQVRSLEGRLNGRVTLAVDYGNEPGAEPTLANESIRLTAPLLYEDSNGEHPYELYPVNGDGSLGQAIPDLQSTGNHVPWSADSGFIYERNPNYLRGSTDTVPPVLGIIAKGRIRVTEDAPQNMVLHAATVSLNSAWTTSYWTSLAPEGTSLDSLKKSNWRHLGSKVAYGGGARYSFYGSYPYPGYSASGEYLYDTRLRSFPPPHFLGEDRPSYGPPFEADKAGVTTTNLAGGL